ncbi:peptidylprolyl isomerase [Gluconacetobacter takamatsuzukensis]|uniref:peptidylprolyl isomerase n=1 Tax=Gluconacetobacter takamatsuzukensis TaxID=1286190 RepID=A0A7W4KDP9_9PROT|nr:peptidylprolyl isomerase [Gluconacetobacter takamatsuzukensis]MBB2204945.1 peptidylprolyl isomerase [Gluconacetobacter takamatsuzukensis]
MRRILPILALLLPTAATAASAAGPNATPSEIVAHAPDTAWADVPVDRLLVMTLANGARITIELAPQFAPVHTDNIAALARAHWWDGGAIIRVQENYVVQWAPRDEKARPPAGFVAHPPAEYDRPRHDIAIRPLGFPDPYAPSAGFAAGWPVAADEDRVWLPHCYGMVGVGRDMPPDTGDGQELYAVNSEAPRQLDRNLAVVGRVLTGMDTFGALPRGTAALGFYASKAQNVAIRSVSLAADLPPARQPHLQVMRTDGPTFTAYLNARANRTDPFFIRPAHGVALCNVPVPVREKP